MDLLSWLQVKERGIERMIKKENVRKIVRERYGAVARGRGEIASAKETEACSCTETAVRKKGEISSGGTCCPTVSADDVGKMIGYSEDDVKNLPDGANLGLGCGNPVALASLKKGETVLDLGSGAGIDCFLAAKRVGKGGHVIGVDMTEDMLEKARENAGKGGYTNVEFRLGEIENLPAADNSVDAIISNCVINLSPDKQRVFREACRVLKPGGRLMVSDIVVLKPLPKAVRDSVAAYVGCLAGALLKGKYLDAMRKAGFRDIKVLSEKKFPLELVANDSTAQAVVNDIRVDMKTAKEIAKTVASISVWAKKPKR